MFLVAPVAGALALDRSTHANLLPGTRVGGVYLGGVSLAEARVRLREAFLDPLRRPLVLTAAGASTTATPWDLGKRVDVGDVLERTYRRQHRGSLVEQMWRAVVGDHRDVRLRTSVQHDALERSIDAAAQHIDRPPRDARLEFTDKGFQVVPDQVGRQVDKSRAVATLTAALATGARSVQLPVQLIQPQLRAKDFHKVILISTTANTLDLYQDGKLVRHYNVATGTGGYPTPHGQLEIVGKEKYPTWSNPHDPWSLGMPESIPPGPDNPLGTRAMYLSAAGIIIHGTPHDDSIGTNASHGCIRMHISEAEDLYDRVDVGTPVLIV